MFKILDYVSKLSISKETETHLTCLCPVCGDDNLKIRKTGQYKGAYTCWSNQCASEKIRESLGYKDSLFSVPKIQPVRIKPREVPFRGTQLLITDNYSPIEPTQKSFIGDYVTESREYPYSAHQRILRIDNTTTKTKYIYIQYLNDDFTWVSGAGTEFWPIYSRGVDFNQKADTILFVEGEKTAEFCKERGLAAITVMSGNFGDKISKNLLILKSQYPITNLLYVPDHDKAGYLKAKKVQESCWRVGLGCKILTMPEITSRVFEGMDLADCTETEFTIFKNNVTRRATAISPGR
jgi:hypothetical protein